MLRSNDTFMWGGRREEGDSRIGVCHTKKRGESEQKRAVHRPTSKKKKKQEKTVKFSGVF